MSMTVCENRLESSNMCQTGPTGVIGQYGATVEVRVPSYKSVGPVSRATVNSLGFDLMLFIERPKRFRERQNCLL